MNINIKWNDVHSISEIWKWKSVWISSSLFFCQIPSTKITILSKMDICSNSIRFKSTVSLVLSFLFVELFLFPLFCLFIHSIHWNSHIRWVFVLFIVVVFFFLSNKMNEKQERIGGISSVFVFFVFLCFLEWRGVCGEWMVKYILFCLFIHWYYWQNWIYGE